VADDKRVAKRRLKELLMAISRSRDDLAVYRRRKKKGDAANVARYERALKLNYSLIRAYCAEHDLELPHDVPPEAHPAASDTE